MDKTLWIVIGLSLLFVFGLVAVIFSQLRKNRETDKHIDYRKLRPSQDDEDDNDKW